MPDGPIGQPPSVPCARRALGRTDPVTVTVEAMPARSRDGEPSIGDVDAGDWKEALRRRCPDRIGVVRSDPPLGRDPLGLGCGASGRLSRPGRPAAGQHILDRGPPGELDLWRGDELLYPRCAGLVGRESREPRGGPSSNPRGAIRPDGPIRALSRGPSDVVLVGSGRYAWEGSRFPGGRIEPLPIGTRIRLNEGHQQESDAAAYRPIRARRTDTNTMARPGQETDAPVAGRPRPRADPSGGWGLDDHDPVAPTRPHDPCPTATAHLRFRCRPTGPRAGHRGAPGGTRCGPRPRGAFPMVSPVPSGSKSHSRRWPRCAAPTARS